MPWLRAIVNLGFQDCFKNTILVSAALLNHVFYSTCARIERKEKTRNKIFFIFGEVNAFYANKNGILSRKVINLLKAIGCNYPSIFNKFVLMYRKGYTPEGFLKPLIIFSATGGFALHTGNLCRLLKYKQKRIQINFLKLPN